MTDCSTCLSFFKLRIETRKGEEESSQSKDMPDLAEKRQSTESLSVKTSVFGRRNYIKGKAPGLLLIPAEAGTTY
jgi:hypothetical protein